MNRPILSIAFVTMNRSEQLKEAINSCLMCNLPKNTEFIIVDNGSIDDTEQIIKKIIEKTEYKFIYHKLNKNIGAGGGRNLCFELSNGYYIYGGDDDAIIDFKNNKDFFKIAIDIFENNKKIASLATQIFDTAWNKNRQEISGPRIGENLYMCKMFSGGSHFLRKDFFKFPPYLNNKYGYEELPASLIVVDFGGINAFCPNLLAIHKPKVNKWDFEISVNRKYLIIECGIPYAIKMMMYPVIAKPLINVVHSIRRKKYLTEVDKKKEKIIINEIMNNYSLNRIKISTLIKLICYFKLSIF